MSIQDFSPWATTIRVSNIAKQIDSQSIIDELLLSSSLQTGRYTGQGCTAETTPVLYRIQQDILVPTAVNYLDECMGYACTTNDIYCETWGMLATDKMNHGIEPHLHPGSILTTVLYLTDSESCIILNDPKGNACRGYPNELRQPGMIFGQFRHTPRAGDLVIFPSYLVHYVWPKGNGLRVAIPTDFYLNN